MQGILKLYHLKALHVEVYPKILPSLFIPLVLVLYELYMKLRYEIKMASLVGGVAHAQCLALEQRCLLKYWNIPLL